MLVLIWIVRPKDQLQTPSSKRYSPSQVRDLFCSQAFYPFPTRPNRKYVEQPPLNWHGADYRR